LREASGSLDEVLLKKELLNDTYIQNFNLTYAFDQCLDRTCSKGSLVDQQLMETVSAWGPLIYAGCFAATLSSAIASLVGAPRVFQAVAKDKLFPGISTFGDGFGPNNDPLKGYILIFFISLACILIGNGARFARRNLICMDFVLQFSANVASFARKKSSFYGFSTSIFNKRSSLRSQKSNFCRF